MTFIIIVSQFSDTLAYLSLKHNFLASLCPFFAFNLGYNALTAAVRTYAKSKGLRDAILTVGPNNPLPQMCLIIHTISEYEEQLNPVKPYFNEGRTLYLDTQTLNQFFTSTHSSF